MRTCSHPSCVRTVTGRNRKCMKHLKVTNYKTETLRDGNKGRNSWRYKGYKKTRKRPKRQGTTGNEPVLRETGRFVKR